MMGYHLADMTMSRWAIEGGIQAAASRLLLIFSLEAEGFRRQSTLSSDRFGDRMRGLVLTGWHGARIGEAATQAAILAVSARMGDPWLACLWGHA